MIATILIGIAIFFAGVAAALSWTRWTLAYLLYWVTMAVLLAVAYALGRAAGYWS